MDTAWALEQCRLWLSLHERVPVPEAERQSNRDPRTKFVGSKDERSRIKHRVQFVSEAIWDTQERRWRRWQPDEHGVRELIFELEEGLEVRERLGLDDAGPALAADALHSWVWQAARPHWESGNHDAAVWAAGINVNTKLKKKVDRPDLGESKLVAAAFGTAPADDGRSRLRLCDEANPDLFRDRHIGALQLGQGLFSGIRNPLSHVGADDMTEQEALETLAAWSLFARWVDRAEVKGNARNGDDDDAETSGTPET
ncbi:TIGR02391 family protein [Nocardioides sp. NPDC126508]